MRGVCRWVVVKGRYVYCDDGTSEFVLSRVTEIVDAIMSINIVEWMLSCLRFWLWLLVDL